jgi:hypothetical protein
VGPCAAISARRSPDLSRVGLIVPGIGFPALIVADRSAAISHALGAAIHSLDGSGCALRAVSNCDQLIVEMPYGTKDTVTEPSAPVTLSNEVPSGAKAS